MVIAISSAIRAGSAASDMPRGKAVDEAIFLPEVWLSSCRGCRRGNEEETSPPMLDLIVRNATLADGRRGIDVGVQAGRIEAVEPHLQAEAGQTIDA